MKIEQLIVQYLYLTKQVTLQGIGTIKLDPAVTLPAENDKDKNFVMPENAFQFLYNLKATEDEGLVNYIVQHTTKILPLASSDLESYSMLAKQFLNIGKPLVIGGVGTVQKNQQGDYQFIPGVFVTPKIDDFPKQIREKRDESVSFESEGKTDNSRRNLIIGITALMLLLGGLGIYYWLSHNQSYEAEPVVQAITAADTLKTDSLSKDTSQTPVTTSNLTDTAAKITAASLPTDSNGFKMVLKNYNSYEAAQKAYNRLRSYGHKIEVVKIDSSLYQIVMPIKAPLADTSRAKDSLRRFFGGNPSVKF
ncbi:MAG: hypothetical protein H7211_13020 [Aquabacterium sp.]|nr:hypothetical protein [Ferruginibacter sp.]